MCLKMGRSLPDYVIVLIPRRWILRKKTSCEERAPAKRQMPLG
jgi:hypothetical protein